MNYDELKKVLADHALWLSSNGGVRADLSRAYLSRTAARDFVAARMTEMKGAQP